MGSQCYLPSGSTAAVTFCLYHSKAGTRFSDTEGCKAELTKLAGYIPRWYMCPKSWRICMQIYFNAFNTGESKLQNSSSQEISKLLVNVKAHKATLCKQNNWYWVTNLHVSSTLLAPTYTNHLVMSQPQVLITDANYSWHSISNRAF